MERKLKDKGKIMEKTRIELSEGKCLCGGVHDAPLVPKPNIQPPPQKPKNSNEFFIVAVRRKNNEMPILMKSFSDFMFFAREDAFGFKETFSTQDYYKSLGVFRCEGKVIGEEI